jgi:alpha-mannosidase
VARTLDTQVEGIPLVVFNPLSIEREDVVEAEVGFSAGTVVQVFDGAGKPVPTQVLPNPGDTNAGKSRILFLAKVPSVGFAVFSARESSDAAGARSLKATERSLENSRYRVTINDAGDIASVFDKPANRELLSALARLALLDESPRSWPAWNMDWEDRNKAPRGYVSGPAKIRVVESGPVRVAVEIERETEGSVFIQTIRLASGEAVNRVEVANRIAWQGIACSLKAEFPLTISNPEATYNMGLGKIQRGNNNAKKYEVPIQQWFDLTDTRGDYGVSVLAPTKYGSDKPADNVLRLTLLYTPGVATNGAYQEQKTQDWGRHEFLYGLSGHAGDWRAGDSDWEAARLGQPLLAFRTAPHPGKLGRKFSLLQTSSDQVMVRTVKLAEDNEQIIVRAQELHGMPARGLKITAAGLKRSSEVNGIERSPKSIKLDRGALALDFKPHQLRSLACTFAPVAKLPPIVAQPIKLPYNLDIFSYNEFKQDGACDNDGATMPAEMIGDKVMTEGVPFQIGSRENFKRNAVACRGQTISLPPGDFNRVYLIACSINGDVDGTFAVDGHATTLRIQDWSGYLGSWDNRVFQGSVPEITFSINNPLDRINPGYIKRAPLAWFASHRHLRNGSDQIYFYSYLFKYRLDLPPGAKTLTLPDNARIRLVAATATRNDNDLTEAARPLSDELKSEPAIQLRAGQ